MLLLAGHRLFPGISMGPSQLFDDEKARILALREEATPVKEIMRLTGHSGSAIQHLVMAAGISCHLPHSIIKPQYKKWSGRPSKTSNHTDWLLGLVVSQSVWFEVFPDQPDCFLYWGVVGGGRSRQQHWDIVWSTCHDLCASWFLWRELFPPPKPISWPPQCQTAG